MVIVIAGIRHGLTAASPLIKGESRAAFDSLLAEFHRTYSPLGLPEELCVFHMATAQWKLLRAMQFESDLINEHMAQTPPAGPPPDSLPAIRRASHAINAIETRPHSLTNVRFHTTHLERSIERHFRQLLALQAIRAHEIQVDPNNSLNSQDQLGNATSS